MYFNVLSAKLTGNPDASGWSQAYEFAPDDSEKLKLRGKLFALISTSSHKEGLDAVVLGREVLLRLHEEYFGKEGGSAFTVLKQAVQKVQEEFASFENVQIAAISLVGKAIFLTACGGSKIYILRQGNLTKLIDSAPRVVTTGSGFPQDKDVFVVGTKLFFDSFPKGLLKGFLQTKNPKTIVESFAPLVHAQALEGSLAVVVLDFLTEQPEKDLPNIAPISAHPTKNNEEVVVPYRKIKNNFSGFFKFLGKSGLYLKNFRLEESASPRKKTSALVGILLLIILSVSIYFGVVQKKKVEFRQTYESQLTSAEHELQEAYDLSELNPQRSRELFESARSKVLGLTTQGIDDAKVAELQQKVDVGQEKILGQYMVDTQLFVDLSLFSEGFDGKKTAVSDGIIYILDEQNKKIVSVGVENKNTTNLGGPALVGDSNEVAAYSDRLFVLNDDGVYEIEGGREKVVENDWVGDVLITSYAANFYVLDKGASSLYRYPGSDSGFGSRQNWFASGTAVDLGGAKDLAIDGAVWVLANEKTIFKFTFGVLQNFGLAGIFPDIGNIDAMFTSEDSASIYLLEKEKERVVVIDKDGNYKAQYVSGKIKDAKRIIVSEKEKKLFLLTGGQLLFIDLKHL